ncbi:MAG: hypothetical protein K6F44_01835 [Lachnospiraceae bacterium]|nr:hypothetical protein [Lachnospiraceae bacterium]
MKNNRVDLDNRKASDIKEQIRTLSKVYVPEWHFDTENPDIGSVIGIIFAEQMAENVGRFNELIDVYHTELANMTGISLLPAQPASTTVVMELASDTVPGSFVRKGTKLFGGDGDRRIIFETSHHLFITNSHLTDILTTQANTGKIRRIIGNAQRMNILPELTQRTGEEEENEEKVTESENEGFGFKPFAAFDESGEELGRNALLLFHSYYFDIVDEKIYMRIDSPDRLADRIMDGTYKLSYMTDKGLKPFDEVGLVKNDILYLKKTGECKKVRRDREYSVLVIEAADNVNERIRVNGIDFSSVGEKQPFQSVGTGSIDCDPLSFRPFSDKLTVFDECFMRHDEYFSRVGARITVSFDVEYGVNSVTMSVAEIEDSLKVVKRKPRLAINTRVVESFVDEISIEYSSSKGWRRLKLSSDESTMFAAAKAGKHSFSFICPDDWDDDGGRGRAIRFQSIRCDNCYMMPCNHNYPIIKNATVEYSYDDIFVKPEHVEVVSNTSREDVTTAFMSGKGITAFRVSSYTDNAIYFGFSSKFAAGPISLHMILEDESSYVGTNLKFEYSSLDGFRTLQVTDKTESFARSGQIRFIPPDDMTAVTVEGRKCYWIRVVDVNGHFSEKNIYRPVIKDIILNTVDVSNIDTHDTEEFFLDEVAPGLTITLAEGNILDAQVWVNEIGKHTAGEMKDLIRDESDRVYAEYDKYGNIEDFFVKWDEVSSFDRSHEGDRHYILDRQTSRIYFGDGVHVAIPTVTTSTAVRVLARSCDGAEANIPADSIDGSMTRVDFLGGLHSLFPAYGGSSIESVDRAMSRASNIIGSRNRIVTMADYKNEILSFSDNINKVECIIGESVDGRKKDGLISIVLLMKDFGRGTHSFDRIVPKLRDHLEKCVELTASFDTIEIVEPIGVAISVDIWMNKMGDETDYAVGLKLTEALESFLSPVSDALHQGWEIGKLPGKSQIMMKLNSLKTGAFIRRLVITGTYMDADGSHECDLENLPANKFYVVKSGIHKAHTISDERLSHI